MENKMSAKVSKKLLNVIKAIGGKVAKSGTNTFQKYKYVTEGDLMDAVRDELINQGLVITTSVLSASTSQEDGSDQYMTHVMLLHTVTDVESGESIQVQSAGSGADKLDKGVYKAITGANKYFIMKTFMLSGDDDPENDGVKAKPTQSQAKPVQEKKGYLEKKTEPKPAFSSSKWGNKAKAAPEPEEPEEAEEESEEEEDAPY